jgi:hypothetical protein
MHLHCCHVKQLDLLFFFLDGQMLEQLSPQQQQQLSCMSPSWMLPSEGMSWRRTSSRQYHLEYAVSQKLVYLVDAHPCPAYHSTKPFFPVQLQAKNDHSTVYTAFSE